ncbi:MAG TPA: helix-turn-helix transcriptional regulator [Polyangiaceae bacterium]
MPLIRIVNAPGLLVRTMAVLGVNQQGLAELIGISRRTIIRWSGKGSGPTYEQWVTLARHAYAKDPALARAIATELDKTLVLLGIEPPPPPPAPPAAPPGPPPRPVPPLPDLVDSVVCAAAEAMAVTPQSVRPALVAAFERAASVGLTMEEVRAALRPPPKATQPASP